MCFFCCAVSVHAFNPIYYCCCKFDQEFAYCVFAFNTSFYEGGHAPETEQWYRRWMFRSIRILRSEYGLSPVKAEKVEARQHLTPEQYTQILKEGGFQIVFRVPPANPNINNRVNIACSLLAHERLLVDPKCHRLINDFQRNEGDGKGAKDKTDPQQTHASDNFDYFVWQNFASDFYKTGVKQL